MEKNLYIIKSCLQKLKTSSLLNYFNTAKEQAGYLAEVTLAYNYTMVLQHVDKNSYRIVTKPQVKSWK